MSLDQFLDTKTLADLKEFWTRYPLDGRSLPEEETLKVILTLLVKNNASMETLEYLRMQKELLPIELTAHQALLDDAIYYLTHVIIGQIHCDPQFDGLLEDLLDGYLKSYTLSNKYEELVEKHKFYMEDMLLNLERIHNKMDSMKSGGIPDKELINIVDGELTRLLGKEREIQVKEQRRSKLSSFLSSRSAKQHLSKNF
jgi:hypothetical protein